MNVDEFIRNKIVDGFKNKTKQQLYDQCEILFKIIWENPEYKEKLLESVNVTIGDITKVISKPKSKPKIKEEPKIVEKVNLPEGINTKDELMETSIKEVLEEEGLEIDEDYNVNEKEEQKPKSEIDEMMM